jgi:hypothetical protein
MNASAAVTHGWHVAWLQPAMPSCCPDRWVPFPCLPGCSCLQVPLDEVDNPRVLGQVPATGDEFL